MSSAARLLDQRSSGGVSLHMGETGPSRIREWGSFKVRLPRGSSEAILINTSGGIAGGDTLELDIEVRNNAQLTITTQAAERVYRTLGPSADAGVSLQAGSNACLQWLPQETIVFDNAALTRRFDVNLHATARFLAIEPVVFGRQAMGERVSKVRLRDRWRIWRDGTLILADDLGFDGALPNSNAALAGNSAMATIIHIGDVTERQVDAIRSWIREAGAVSAWNGKLVARTLARDGFDLRKSVIPALDVLTGASGLPKVWSF